LILKFELQVTITTAVNLSSLLPVVNKSTVFSRSSTGEAILPAGALKNLYKPWTTFHFFVDKKIIGYILSLLKDDCQMNIFRRLSGKSKLPEKFPVGAASSREIK